MATQKLNLSLEVENGVVVGGSVDPIHPVLVRRYFEFRQDGGVKNKPLDLDEMDRGEYIHWPLTATDKDGNVVSLNNHGEAKTFLKVKHDDPELEPGDLEWLPNSDQYVQYLYTRTTHQPNVIEYVTSAAVANLQMQDEMFLVDKEGKVVSVIDPQTNKPVDGVLECEDFSGSVLEFTNWLKERYHVEYDGRLPSNWAIHRLLRPSGDIEEVCYRHVYGKDLGLTPKTLEVKFTPTVVKPEPDHSIRRAYVVSPNGGMVNFNPRPRTEIDWLPIVMIDKPGFAPTVRGLHGRKGLPDPGIIDALMLFDPPPTEELFTDPKYHWKYAGNGLWFEAMRPGGGVLELRATTVLWSEEDA